MNAEQTKQAAGWATLLSEWALSRYPRTLTNDDCRALSNSLLDGIAASEECERLRAHVTTDNSETLKNALAQNEIMQDRVTRLCGMLYDEQLRRMSQPESPAVREMLRRLSDEEISNGKAAEIILDFIAGASSQAWLAAWDAEWRAQAASSYAAFWEDECGRERGRNCDLRALLERAARAIRGLADQQAMEDDWHEPLLAEIEEVGKC